MKWKNELSKSGLTEATLSQGLKKKVRDYYSIEKAIAVTKQDIADSDDDEQIEALKGDLSDFEESLEVLDEAISNGIVSYLENKDKYAEIGKKMKEGRDKKKSGGAVATATKSDAPAPTPTPAPAPTPAPTNDKKEESKEGEKKKSNVGGIIFGLVIAGLTLGLATQYLKNRD